MGRPTKAKAASRSNGAKKSKPTKRKKQTTKKSTPAKLVPVLGLSSDYIDKREKFYVKFIMLASPKKGYAWAFEADAVRYCMTRERRVRFEDSPPAKEPQTHSDREQQHDNELRKAYCWIKELPDDPELRGARLRALAKRAGLQFRA